MSGLFSVGVLFFGNSNYELRPYYVLLIALFFMIIVMVLITINEISKIYNGSKNYDRCILLK